MCMNMIKYSCNNVINKNTSYNCTVICSIHRYRVIQSSYSFFDRMLIGGINA